MKFPLIMAAFALLAALPLTAKAFDNDKVPMLKDADAMAEVVEAPAIKAVIFYSDTCGSCKILDPRMKEAMNAINKDEVEVVKFDFSNKDAIEATKTLAAKSKVENILQEYGAKTGFVVLVNSQGEIVEKLTKADEIVDIAVKVAKSIALSNAS